MFQTHAVIHATLKHYIAASVVGKDRSNTGVSEKKKEIEKQPQTGVNSYTGGSEEDQALVRIRFVIRPMFENKLIERYIYMRHPDVLVRIRQNKKRIR